jgi:lipopolysaccharide export system protein LptA
MHIISDTGIKNDLNGDIWASGNVQADALVEGIRLKTDELAYDAETQLITSSAHVRLTKANIITAGFGLKSDLHLEKVIILRDVETILSHPDPLSPPVVITADTLQLDHSAEIATYTGHVLVTQGTSEIRANLMRVHIQQLSGAENSIERIDVFGDVRITQDQMLATGDKGRYTSQSQTVILTGTPDQQAHAEDAVSGRSLDADLIRVFLETNDFEGEGNVKFTGVPGL